MKLDFEQAENTLTISAYAAGEITVGGQTLTRPFVLCAEELTFDVLPLDPESLDVSHIKMLLAYEQSMILLGAGSKQIILSDSVMSAALESNVGIEVMTTAAACRSYNVLIAENRSLVGAFFMP